MTVPEAPLESSEHGLLPAGEGWFVLNARDARWNLEGTGQKLTFFEGPDGRFEQLGVNVSVLEPGQQMAMYHWEDEQEDFLVISGEALLIVEGQERRFAPGTSHTARGRRGTSSSEPVRDPASSSPWAPG